jgi:hypothetical protein
MINEEEMTSGAMEQFVKRGYLTNLSIEKIFDDGLFSRFDLKLALAENWKFEGDFTWLRFIDAHDIRIGNDREGMHLGAQLLLVVSNISPWDWDGLRFKVVNDEQELPLSLYCRAYEIAKI